MGTFVLKRKSYNLPGDPAGRNEIRGENAGDSIGRSTGSLAGGTIGAGAGLGTGLVAGGITGAVTGAKQVSNARKNATSLANKAKSLQDAAHSASTAGSKSANAIRKEAAGALKESKKITKLANTNKFANSMKKAGKYGLIAGAIGTAAGALAGKTTGEKVGENVGVATGGAVGSLVDSVKGQKSYSVSRVTKSIYGVASKVTPKSSKMKLARKAVKADQSARLAMFEAATNPGGVAKKVVKGVSENPVTMMPGGLSVGGSLATAINKGKPSTIDSVIKKTKIGKPVYSALEYTGKKVGEVAEPAVNTLANIAKGM